MILPLLSVWALASTSHSAEAAAARHISMEFERVGRNTPVVDPTLSRAARALAERAMDDTLSRAGDLLTQVEAISRAGGTDPTPRALLVRASPPEEVLRTFLRRDDFNDEPATHAGVAIVTRGKYAVLTVLLADRKAEFEAMRHHLAKPGQIQSLCGRMTAALNRPELFITRPNGAVDKLAPITKKDNDRFCFTAPFPSEGRHTVELLARGPSGPEVAALFFVQVGQSIRSDTSTGWAEPTELEQARPMIVERINALRAGNRLSALEYDSALEQIAQRYAERMNRERFFAHVAPDGNDLRARMEAANYRYHSVGENLGLASGPLAAHFGIEHSPGHRRNLLDPNHSRLGVGISAREANGRREVLLVQVLARAASTNGDPLELAYESLARERMQKRLPRLSRHRALEQIALDHLKVAIEQDEPRTQLPGQSIAERVFAQLPEVTSAAADFFVADEPAAVTESKNLLDARNSLVGVAAIRNDSQRFGKDRYWVVVVYASTR